jgi:hypothetical protein
MTLQTYIKKFCPPLDFLYHTFNDKAIRKGTFLELQAPFPFALFFLFLHRYYLYEKEIQT